jgi:signal transduction histidine kinase
MVDRSTYLHQDQRARDGRQRFAPRHPAGLDWAFLANASERLADSLDYDTTLHTVAGLCMPMHGCWTIVDLLDGDGAARRLAVVHPDPDRGALAGRLESAWPPRRHHGQSVPVAALTGESELIADVTEAVLAEVAGGDDELRVLRRLEIVSLITVPMVAHGRTIGAMTFVSSSHERVFQDEDVALAEDLARRCAVAIANARCHCDALARADAYEARRRAEIAAQVKTELLMLLSHELRTPLNGIAGYLELLDTEMPGPLTPRQRLYVERLQAGEHQLLRMVEDMLDFIRLSAGGEIHYDLADVPLARVVRTLDLAYRPVLEEQGIEFRTDCPADLSAFADATKVWQILFNLLSNARKFTQRGGRVSVECVAEGERVEMRVRDTGVGVQAAKLDRIFQAFTQADDLTLTRDKEGLGLGLTVSRQLARGMGGGLSGWSVPGGGCTFTVSLPRHPGQHPLLV